MPRNPVARLLSAAPSLSVRRLAGAALVAIAVTGGTAEAARLVRGSDIANGTITSRDIKDGSIAAKDLDHVAVERLRGMRGADGDPGAQGPKGDTGQQGERGPAGPQGVQGPRGYTGWDGPRGPRGKSAYRIWLDAGNVGDEAAFLASQRGADATKLIAVTGDAAGTLLAGSGLDPVAPVTHQSAGSGVYVVKFDRAVAQCALQATGRGTTPVLLSAAPVGSDGHSVQVSAFSADGVATDAAFSLTVFCG